MAHLEIRGRHASLKDGVALVFDSTAMTKAALFIGRSEDLPNLRPFEHTAKPERIHKA
jgi:hypothetical protein